METCVKCGKKFQPTLFKPLTICKSCQEILRKEVEEYTKNTAKKD